MDCDATRKEMGAYLDGELPAEHAAGLQRHLEACSACADELKEWRAVIGQVEAERRSDLRPPPELWQAIETKLNSGSKPHRVLKFVKFLRRPLAAAASLAFLLGSGVFVAVWLNEGAQVAQASAIDYGILMDGVASDVEGAFRRFLTHYGAKRIEPAAAPRSAPHLRFALPAELDGGFQLQDSYELRFGNSPGIAARYLRGQEPLFVFFHPPVDQERLGVHRESHCEVAGRSGYCIESGAWRLIHFTDPTTCHCVLSRLTSEADLYSVMAAVSPQFSDYADRPDSHR